MMGIKKCEMKRGKVEGKTYIKTENIYSIEILRRS